MLSDKPADTSQIVSHSAIVDALHAKPAAPMATTPISTPPIPETCVKEEDRSIVSRI